jgi:hypothetical protein
MTQNPTIESGFFLAEIYSVPCYNSNMDKETQYTWISFNRVHLFKVTALGFMASRIGSLWCEGFIPNDRLSLMTVPYEIKETK